MGVEGLGIQAFSLCSVRIKRKTVVWQKCVNPDLDLRTSASILMSREVLIVDQIFIGQSVGCPGNADTNAESIWLAVERLF